MATAKLKMSYDEMQAQITKLKQYVEEFEATTRSMSDSVDALCEGWISDSTEAFRGDYTRLTNNFTQTVDIVKELTQSASQYIADMQAVDNAYSKSKVTVG